MPTVMLSVGEAAQRLGISKFTVRAWLRQRRLPFFQVGRRQVLDAADIERFLASNRVEAQESRAMTPVAAQATRVRPFF